MNTLKDLLDIAIEQEVNSQKLYRKGMELVNDKETKQFLKRLADEEIEHEKMLFNIRETGIYDLHIVINDDSIFAATKVSHGSNQFEFDDRWTIEDVLEIALKREYNAQKRYEAAAAVTDNSELMTLLNNLASEEAIHHREVEKRYKLLKGIMGEEL